MRSPKQAALAATKAAALMGHTDTTTAVGCGSGCRSIQQTDSLILYGKIAGAIAVVLIGVYFIAKAGKGN